MAQRRPQHVVDFLADPANATSTQLPALLISPLSGRVHTALAHSGIVQMASGFIQDAVNAAALTVWAYGMYLLDQVSGCVHKSGEA